MSFSAIYAPTVVDDYQQRVAPDAAWPTIHETFIPGQGWRRFAMRKRITASYARTLRRSGVTVVAINIGGRIADFNITELCSRRRRRQPQMA